MDEPSQLILFMGRLHIVLVHLPIGFLVLLGMLELISIHPKWRHATLSNRFVLYITAPMAVLTAICGWLLAESGGYDERLLFLHRWTGVGVAVVACLLLWMHVRGWVSAYRVLILATMVLTIFTGHLGGSLTHGSDFLTRYAPVWFWDVAGTTSVNRGQGGKGGASRYPEIESTFTEYCVSCHGPEKSKGGLRLDSIEHLRAGGDSGPVLVTGDPASSLLLTRILLPLEDDDHMPPEGKPQPSKADVERIREWIESGGGR